jgi:3-hydroxy-3-methylglutaryl CoA synthase
MASIIGYAAQLPTLRLPASAYKAAWGSCAASGLIRKTVCAYDEDAVTLAIAAAQAALAAAGHPRIVALYLGSTTLPYEEKPSSASVLTALTAETPPVYELRGSPQAGLQALALAAREADLLSEGACALAIAADVPAAPADAPYEHALGAGAAAFVLGPGSGIATVGAPLGLSRETFGARFRRRGDATMSDLELRTQEDRAVMAALGAAHDLRADHLATGLSPRAGGALAKLAGAQGDTLWPQLGDCGAASAPVALTDRLDAAEAGQQVLAVAVGAGAYAVPLTINAPQTASSPVSLQLEAGSEIDYTQYLKHRRILSTPFGGTA